MLNYITLGLITAIIVWLSVKILKKSGDFSFLIGFLLLYYWTFAGSWLFIYNDLNENRGNEFGLHYTYLFEKMFPVSADAFYLQSMLLYGLFFILLQVIILFRIKGKINQLQSIENKRFYIHPLRVFIVTIAALSVSIATQFNEIQYAVRYDLSIYTITRSSDNVFYALHKLANLIALLPLLLGFMLQLSARDGIFFIYKRKRGLLFIYLIFIVIVEMYMVLLGNKHELLFSLIFCFIIYLVNFKNVIYWKKIFVFLLIIITPLVFINKLRGYTFDELYRKLTFRQIETQKKPEEKEKKLADKALIQFIFSNELFAANFSMYGVLSKNVNPQFGISFRYLFYAIVPRFIRDNRPPDSYNYYATSVKAKEGQGYTIHHVTGWYLNFGIFGIILGAVFLSILWVSFHNALFKMQEGRRLLFRVFIIICFATIVAEMPQIIRAGPEAYKSIFLEAFIFPTLFFFLVIYKSKPRENE
jgi:hypothetical protein